MKVSSSLLAASALLMTLYTNISFAQEQPTTREKNVQQEKNVPQTESYEYLKAKKTALLKQLISMYLRDPESARFGSLVFDNDIVCGYVSAKNAYGGYTGQQPFLYEFDRQRLIMINSDNSVKRAERFNACIVKDE